MRYASLSAAGVKRNVRKADRQHRAFRPGTDLLEDRVALSAAQASGLLRPAADVISFRHSLRERTLEIRGTSGADSVEVGRNARGLITLTVNDREYSADPRDRDTYDRRLVGLRADRLQGVRLIGSDPLDTVVMQTAIGNGRSAATVQSQSVTISSAVSTSGLFELEAQTVTISAPIQADSIVLTVKGLLNLDADGSLTATRGISLNADRLVQTGNIQAESLSIQANVLIRSGTITASGGSVNVDFTENYVATEGAAIDVSGPVSGGSIRIDGGASGHLFNSGTLLAKGANEGGSVRVSGKDVVWIGGGADVSGGSSGGLVHIGGGWQGSDASMTKARTLQVSPHTVIRAEGSQQGGTVVLWSEDDTANYATISATGAAGGAVEVSSKLGLTHAGSVEVGPGGTFLIDPKNIVIESGSETGLLPRFQLVNPTPSADDKFGADVVPLTTGNIVVTAWGNDAIALDAGAVYLFSGASGGLISVLTGSLENDRVGYRASPAYSRRSVTALSNGNYVVSSPYWSNGPLQSVGAATWGSGSNGVSGVVSSMNSLVGSNWNDNVASAGVTALTNGNYVVSSPYWNAWRGAVTWGNGSIGITGPVTTVNSLYGTQGDLRYGFPYDQVGAYGVTALSNGNYVVQSPYWDNGPLQNVGAATWGNGAVGLKGVAVSSSNSLIGTSESDQVGLGVVSLPNGNYLVTSFLWNGKRGAVTWGNGSWGISGNVTQTNSLVGSSPNDEAGNALHFDSSGYSTSEVNGGVTVLPNGNYVVRTQKWNGSRGAVTWGMADWGISGTISSNNSLVGSSPNDQIASQNLIVLSNSNYVVRSPFWNNGAIVDAGAVTFSFGSFGVTGVVSSDNSLVGSSTNDRIGSSVEPLSNGNYVVRSGLWDYSDAISGITSDAGAITLGNGVSGTKGSLSINNSLVGTQSGGMIDGIVKALTDGNYVLSFPNWDKGGLVDVGAVLWRNGSVGTSGFLSPGNALVGSKAGDQVGLGGVLALPNGNYAVSSPKWDNDDIENVGAVTWRAGGGANSDTVSISNSLTGSNAGDQVGSGMPGVRHWDGMTLLPSGRFVVNSPNWNGGIGAVTMVKGDNGSLWTGAPSGQPNSVNSITGTRAGLITINPANDSYIIEGRERRSDIVGPVYVGLDRPFIDLSFASAPGSTMNLNSGFVIDPLTAGASLTLQANNDITFANPLVVNNLTGNGGALTLQAGRSVAFNANVLTDSGNLTVLANADAATGVVNAHRDAGAGGISLASGIAINVGTGVLSLTSGTAAGLTHRTSGGVNLASSVTAGSVAIVTASSGAGAPNVSVNGTWSFPGGPRTFSIDSAAGVSFGSGAAIGGFASGTITAAAGPVTFAGMLSPGPTNVKQGSGVLTIAGTGIALTSTAVLNVNGTSRTAFDKIVARGVSLGGSTLNLGLSALSLNVGQSITLIDNTSDDPTAGTFSGMAEGATFTVNGRIMQITYAGGDGNDVVVTRIGGSATPNWNVSLGGLFYVRSSASYRSILTLANMSPVSLTPVMLKIMGLPERVSVVGGVKEGSNWLLTLTPAAIAASSSRTVPVFFQVSSGGMFSYSVEVIEE